MESERIENGSSLAETRYRELVELLPQIVFEIDMAGIIVYANPQAERALGRTLEEVRGKNSVLEFVAAEDRERVRESMARVRPGQCAINEYRLRRPSGETFPVSTYSAPILRDGRVVGLRGVMVDITERKRTEEKAFESRRMLEVILDHFPGLAYRCRIDGGRTIEFVSRGCLELTGHPAEALIGNRDVSYDDLIDPQYRESIRQKWQQAMTERKPFTAEYPIVTATGEQKWVLERGQCLYARDGTVLALEGFAIDISERRKVEQALAESNESYRGLFNGVPEAIYIQNRQGVFLDVNHAAVKMYGISRETMIGHTPESVTAPDKNDLGAVARRVEQAFDGTPQKFEFWGRRSDGVIFPKEVRLQRGTYFGEDVVIAIASDITERKRNESLQQALFEISETASRARDTRGLFFAIHRIIGGLMEAKNFYIALYDAKTDLISFPYFVDEFDPPEEPRPPQKGVTEYVLRTGEPLLLDSALEAELEKRGEIELLGTSCQCWCGVPLKNVDGVTFGVMVTQTYHPGEKLTPTDLDVLIFVSQHVATAIERKKAEEELRQTEAQFQQLQKMETIGTLVGSIAHDYNNVLTTIMGHTQLLEHKLKEEHPEWLRHVKAIMGAATDAAGMIQQLLDYSRQEDPAPESLNLSRLIREWADDMRRAVEERITLELDLAGDLCPVFADPPRIRQVLMNLIVNARDALPEGGTVTVATQNRRLEADSIVGSCRMKAGLYAALTVHDNGSGIRPEDLKRIFTPFFTTKEKGKGTGLGLSTVKRVVERLGGGVSVKSDPGSGTLFTVLLPASMESEPARFSMLSHPEFIAGTGQPILVVEDELRVRETMAEMLMAMHYDVITAESGRQALEILAAREVMLVITDIRMPGMDGFELYHEISTRYPQLAGRVCAMSAYTEAGIENLQETGFCAVFNKPTDFLLLNRVLQGLLGPNRPATSS